MSASVLDRFRQSSIERAIPLQASLELTHRCNERCRHCYIEDFRDDQERLLDFEGWQKVLSELREAGTLYLILMGGEPMLSKMFYPVAEEAQRLGFHLSMISNGLLVKDASVAQKLKSSGMHAVTFSFYSLDPQVHDRLTQVRGSQVKTQRAIEFCREAGLEVHVNCLLTKENVGGIFDLEDWCMQRDLQLKADPMVTSGLNGSAHPLKLRMSREQLRWFYRMRTRRWPKSRPLPMSLLGEGHVCNAAKGKCAVTPYGELLPCIEIREPLGNLSRQSFAEIWQSPQGQRWRGLRNRQIGWKEAAEFCDHCPGMAKNESGDAHKVLDFAQVVAEVKKQVYLETIEDQKSFEHGLPAI